MYALQLFTTWRNVGFTGVNAPKKSFFSSTYALHKAAEAGNVKMVRGQDGVLQ